MDRDLYTQDCQMIFTFHNVFQIVNKIGMILGLFGSLLLFLAMNRRGEDFLAVILPLSLIVITALSYAFSRLMLNVIFGVLYDIRMLRMQSQTITTVFSKPQHEDGIDK